MRWAAEVSHQLPPQILLLYLPSVSVTPVLSYPDDFNRAISVYITLPCLLYGVFFVLTLTRYSGVIERDMLYAAHSICGLYRSYDLYKTNPTERGVSTLQRPVVSGENISEKEDFNRASRIYYHAPRRSPS